MKTEILLLLGAGFYIADTLHDGKYSSQFVKYKKHFKIVTILFVVFSIYTFITLISLNVLSGSLHKSEMSGKLRFQSKVEFSAETKSYLLLFFVIGYLIFVSLVTRVPHCCPQPNEIPLRGFFGLT